MPVRLRFPYKSWRFCAFGFDQRKSEAKTLAKMSASATDHAVEVLPTPIKGDADWRDFRCLKLENGVTLCLVHDGMSKTTAAAATVNAGASADPRTLSGLAHFCEHMCFLGSEKYPGENEYKSFLAQHGGSSNASTSMHLTTYKFEILADYAEKALDIFSNFFIAPLFTKSGTGREVNAVDSENSKNLVADGRRRLQILKSLGDQSHYYTKFSTGNSKTLQTDTPEGLEKVREALLAFHRKHYRPENLTVVVAGPQSLDQLQAWAVPRFAGMQARAFPSTTGSPTESEQLVEEAAKDAPIYHHSAPPQAMRSAFSSSKELSWPRVYTVKPVRSMRLLSLMFPMPPVLHVADQSPSSMLSHLLGHEGPGSSFAILQNRGWLSSLSAGPRVAAPDFTLFQVSMSLTESGEEHWKEVVAVVLEHCRLLGKADLADMQRIWGEKAALNSIHFHQTSPGGVYSLAPGLSNSLVLYGAEGCLSRGSMLEESAETYPAAAVSEFCSRLLPSNCLIERCSESAWEEALKQNGVETKTEKWYGIDYLLSPTDKEATDRWTKGSGEDFGLALPRKNEYIPSTLELCEELPDEAKAGPRIDLPIDPPNLLASEDNIGHLWHRLDDRYALPKSSLTLLLRNAATEHVKGSDGIWRYDVHASVQSTLVSGMFHEALAQETYDADLAGLRWGLSLTSEGLRLSCNGYSDKLSDLALQVLRRFLSGSFIKESHFASSKDRLLRSLKTYFQSRRADSHSMYYRDFLLGSEDEGLDAAIEAVESCTLDSVRAHQGTVLAADETQVECLYSGNVSESSARQFFAEAKEQLASRVALKEDATMWVPGPIERRLVRGSDIELHFSSKNASEENGSVQITYQSPIPGFRGEDLSDQESLRSSASMRLLCKMLREPLFDELRTKQTLGYIVSSYFDIGFSSSPCVAAEPHVPWSVPVDSVVISVLSRKVAPGVVVERIDEFLAEFRKVLVNMPESEIGDYASALSTQLLKPIQKLGSEASTQFSKIKRFSPELLGTEKKMPWDNSHIMAKTIRSLNRQGMSGCSACSFPIATWRWHKASPLSRPVVWTVDPPSHLHPLARYMVDILETWDRLVLPASRSRVVSCVYGTTFPLQRKKIPSSTATRTVIVDNLSEIVRVRSKLPVFDNSTTKGFHFPMPGFVGKSSIAALSAAALVGAGVLAAGWTIMNRPKKASR